MTGVGTKVYEDGGVYIGKWLDGKRHGDGDDEIC